MGLRQLYFLLGGLLKRLVYLSYGLAVILGFIGVKLVMEAMAENTLPFINGGEHIEWVPHIPIWLSLTIILTVLMIATVASLVKTKGQFSVEEPVLEPEEAEKVATGGPEAAAEVEARIKAQVDNDGPGGTDHPQPPAGEGGR
jgi:tellurite resistance protein TerC